MMTPNDSFSACFVPTIHNITSHADMMPGYVTEYVDGKTYRYSRSTAYTYTNETKNVDLHRRNVLTINTYYCCVETFLYSSGTQENFRQQVPP